MTLSRRELKRVNSPQKSPKLLNTSLRKKMLLKKLPNDVQFGSSSKANLKVVVRVRPNNAREIENNAKEVVQIVDDHMLVFDPKDDTEDFFYRGKRQEGRDLLKKQNREQKFIFEKVFNENATNEEVYEATTQDIIDTLLKGFNCSVFAYGATGAGKTYTMLGKPEVPGITFMTVMDLFKRIDELKEEKMCTVAISYLEVYNETVRDLLKPGKALNVLESGKKVEVQGLSIHKPKSAEELMEMLAQGNCNRSQHPTDINAESSRSHAVFQVFVKMQDKVGCMKTNIGIAKLSMIDLAGSERGCATGFKGTRFREGASINRSLLALGNCINALADGRKHINYRDSKLTRLLKDSLGGNCRSVMIAAITTASTSYEDTLNTLKYANRAKTIKTTLKKNILNVDQHVSQYVKIVENLQEEIRNLQGKLKELEKAPQQCPECLAREEIHGVPVVNNTVKTKEISKEEQKLKDKLHELDMVLKSEVKELLRLEAQEKELYLKVYICQLHRERANLLAFASLRLDKSVSKCDRMLHSTEGRLQTTMSLIEEAKSKVAHAKANLQAVVDEISKLENATKSVVENDAVIESNELKGSVRDYEQVISYYQNLVKTCFVEQSASEQVIHQLLNACKHFFIYIKSKNVSNPEIVNVFENLVKSLDNYKVGFDGSNEVPVDVSDNVSKLTRFSVDHEMLMSPVTIQAQPKCVRSILIDNSQSSLPVTNNTEMDIKPKSSVFTQSFASSMNSVMKLLNDTTTHTLDTDISTIKITDTDMNLPAQSTTNIPENETSDEIKTKSTYNISEKTYTDDKSSFITKNLKLENENKVFCSISKCEELKKKLSRQTSFAPSKPNPNFTSIINKTVESSLNKQDLPIRNIRKSFSTSNLNETFDAASCQASEGLSSIQEMSPICPKTTPPVLINSTITIDSKDNQTCGDMNSTYVQEDTSPAEPVTIEKQSLAVIEGLKKSRSRQPISLSSLDSFDIDKPVIQTGNELDTHALMDSLNSTFNVPEKNNLGNVLHPANSNKSDVFTVPQPKPPPKSILKKSGVSQRSLSKSTSNRTPCKRSSSMSSLNQSGFPKPIINKDKFLGFGSSVKRSTSFLSSKVNKSAITNKENLSSTNRRLKSFKASATLPQFPNSENV